MGWGPSASVGTQDSTLSSNQNTSSSDTTTASPVLDDRWKTAFDAVGSALGAYGATPDQQAAIDFNKSQMSPGNPVNAQVGLTNSALGLTNGALSNAAQYFGNQSTRDSYTLGSLAAKAAAGVPGYGSYAAPTPVAANAVSAQTIDPRSGAAFISDYQNPYTNSVVDSTLANYDKNVANQYNALRASR
ncbi:MAG: hypothetical protein ACXWCQ_35105, partial [Burkholderiales bacterium]